MSEKELLRKFYSGSYKINSQGKLVCIMYNEHIPDNEQLCNYSLEIQDELTDAEFNTFWLHVESAHQDTYGSILDLCRLKASTKAKENPKVKIHQFIGNSFTNINTMVSLWISTDISNNEFVDQFKSELVSLEKAVTALVMPSSASSNTGNIGESFKKI